jgi:hypothetical protein
MASTKHRTTSIASDAGGAPKGARRSRSAEVSRPSASGTSRSYAERAAKGRPNVTLSMSTSTSDLLSRLAESYKLSRSAVVELALRELEKRHH